MLELIDKARAGDKFSIAKLVSFFESQKGEDEKKCITIDMEIHSGVAKGLIVGLTGAPGAGKSTLIQHLVDALLARDSNCRVAIVAVDPSSPISGGSLLGDRTRVNFGANERAYFRSQASDLELGGIGRNTFRVCRLLRAFFDFVIVESVGVGQSEIEISQLADVTLLALQPFAGDQIQFMKSGIMEIPQAFVITKCDADDLAQKSKYQLEASLDFVQRVDRALAPPEIFQTSSVRKTGFEALAKFVATREKLSQSADITRENYFLKKEIRHYYGINGLRGESLSNENALFEERRLTLLARLESKLGSR